MCSRDRTSGSGARVRPVQPEHGTSLARLPVLVMRDLEAGSLARHVDRAIEALRAGDFRAADAKKLRNAGLYRARLDDTNRLLFKFGEHDGRKVLLVLEIVRNHAYDRSRFLNGAPCTQADFEPAAAAPSIVPPADRLRYVHPTSTALHLLDKPLSFDDAQAAVFATPLPLIVVGSAGSGKTALTLEKLKTILSQYPGGHRDCESAAAGKAAPFRIHRSREQFPRTMRVQRARSGGPAGRHPRPSP
jgi:hypothetical protein